jgi:2,3-bisphosphoglycerate-independent phosphoglycerate mutase
MNGQNKPKIASVRHAPSAHGPVVLVVLDGWGIAPAGPGNAISLAKTPNMDRFAREYPMTHLMAHGRYVGLLPDQEGNSEAGHSNIGAGRIVRQDIVHVTEAIKDRTFFKNTAFKEVIKHARKYGTTVHVMGMLANGNSAHSSPDHLRAVLQLVADEKMTARLHLFTDGRDSRPFSARTMLREVEALLTPEQKIASISGRFYAMDRNKFWDRTEKAYHCITHGEGLTAPDAMTALLHGYDRGESDEFILPTAIVDAAGKPIGAVEANDVFIFFNLRSDRARQLAKCFVQRDFEAKNEGAFTRRDIAPNTRFAALADFGPDLEDMYTAFPNKDIQKGLTETLADYRQFYIAESEKYAHVTYFMNGGYAQPLRGEDRMRVPSANVMFAKELPEMRARIISEEVSRRVQTDLHDFICVNFANADMVGHSGDIEATRKAIEAIDRELGKIADAVLAKQGTLLITGDHGNAEQKLDPATGEAITEHTLNPVPFHIVSDRYKGVHVGEGMLGDVAPTILEIMDIPKPEEMTGFSLIRS